MTQLKARPTTYKGVEMRSRLEAGFAAWLDGHKVEWEYEPRAFASGAGQYLPDFRVQGVLDVRSRSERPAYVEVKPRQPDPGSLTDAIRCQADDPMSQMAAIARKMAVIWESEPDALLLLAWPDLVDDRCGGVPAIMSAARTSGPLKDRGVEALFIPDILLSQRAGGLAIGTPIRPAFAPWPEGYWEVQ